MVQILNKREIILQLSFKLFHCVKQKKKETREKNEKIANHSDKNKGNL